MELNLYGAVILAALGLDFLAGAAADLLNLRALRAEVPPELEGICDGEAYRTSQDYTRVRTRFGLLKASCELLVLLLFWWAGGFRHLDGLARGAGLGPVGTGLLFLGSLFLLSRFLSLPFATYSTFVIEEEFGFNRTTPATFLKDLVKGGALAVLLGGPFLAGVLAIFEAAGSLAWLSCWLGAAVYVLAVQFVAPAWLLPLFNRFTPLEEGGLRRRIMECARSLNFPVKEIYVMDGSRRSSKSNAFFTGFGRNRRIALYDTLVERQSAGEVVAVVAHEIGHFRRKHVLQGMGLSVLHMGAVLFCFSLVLAEEGLFAAFRLEQVSVYAGMVFFGLLLAPVETLLSVFFNWLSRTHEYEADRFAVRATGRPEVLEQALRKLAAANLANLTPHPLVVLLRYSHPPLLQRIRALRQAGA